MARLFKHVRIGLGTFALMLLAASAHGPGGPGLVVAQVAHAGEIARSEVVDTLHMIDAEFALSEPVYRGTDRGDAMLILSLVFPSIVAFNLWLFLHLHRVCAPMTAGQRREVKLEIALHELHLADA